jgi:hypothetical protein
MHLRSTTGQLFIYKPEAKKDKSGRYLDLILLRHPAFAGLVYDIDGISQCKVPQNSWFMTREKGNLSHFAAAWANMLQIVMLRLHIKQRMDRLQKVEAIANPSHKREVPNFFYQALCECMCVSADGIWKLGADFGTEVFLCISYNDAFLKDNLSSSILIAGILERAKKIAPFQLRPFRNISPLFSPLFHVVFVQLFITPNLYSHPSRIKRASLSPSNLILALLP